MMFRCDSLEQQHQGFRLVSMVSSSSSLFVSRPDHACLMVVLVRFDELRMKAKAVGPKILSPLCRLKHYAWSSSGRIEF
ncbi:hypothetical protein GBA52_007984 [Prunus armeniaca]|nr:hypothetical protein GBA52_007984 [Prunus armeniaca]